MFGVYKQASVKEPELSRLHVFSQDLEKTPSITSSGSRERLDCLKIKPIDRGE